MTSPFAKISFERTYGGADFDYGRSVQQTSDGGYAVIGETHSFGLGWGDVYLLRVDSLGDTLWSNTFGGALYDCGRSIEQTSDGGFIIAGETQSYGAGANDVYVIRTDSLGGVLWTRTYGGGGYECGYSVTQTPDGDFVVAGETESFGSGGRDFYLLKIDFLGNLVLDTTYGGSGSERAFGVDATSDGGYAIVGHTSSFGSGADDIYLVRTDDSGSVVWTQTYGTASTEWGRSVQETPDGGFVIVGETRASGVFNLYMVMADSLGGVLWDTSYGGTSHDRCMSGTRTFEGGFALVGYTQSFGAGDYDVYLIETDSTGDTLWTRTFGGSSEDRGAFVQQTEDSGFVVAGYTESFGVGGYDVYLIKVRPDGVVARHDGAVLGIDSPPDTVIRDSIYPVVATVRNLGNVALSCDVVATLDSYVDTFYVGDLPSDSTIQIAFSDWQAPGVDSITLSLDVCALVVGDVDTTNNCAQKTIFAFDPTGTAEQSPHSDGLRSFLSENRPNPFSEETIISFHLATSCHASLSIYDVMGRLVDRVVDRWLGPGSHSVTWQATGKPTGVYFYRLRTRDFSDTKRLLLLR